MYFHAHVLSCTLYMYVENKCSFQVNRRSFVLQGTSKVGGDACTGIMLCTHIQRQEKGKCNLTSNEHKWEDQPSQEIVRQYNTNPITHRSRHTLVTCQMYTTNLVPCRYKLTCRSRFQPQQWRQKNLMLSLWLNRCSLIRNKSRM